MDNYWITVVDDDAMCMANTKNILTEQNMRVSCLRSGANFMKFIQSNTPDLVLLDIMMPGTDGFQTYHKLREFEKQAGREPVPVIFLSSENPSETVPYGLKIGAADYVSKPCEPIVLMSRIQRAIENSSMIKGLIKDSEHDKLTGFLNKASGAQKTAELCSSKTGALLVMDLDSFKLVNDLYGHDTGDKILVLFSETVKKNTRANDVVCRVGGDEFTVFLADIKNEETAAAIAKRVSDTFVAEAKKLLGNDHDIPLGISVGMALSPLHSADFDTLFRYADQAMYRVKKNGRHGFAMYDAYTDEPDSGTDPDKELERLTQIVGERDTADGAMLLGQDAFTTGYRYIMRLVMHYHSEVSQVVLSVTAQNGVKNMSGKVEEFGAHLKKTLRICDIVMQSRSNQFFLILPGMSEKEADKTVHSLLGSWNADSSHEGTIINRYIRTLSFRRTERDKQ